MWLGYLTSKYMVDVAVGVPRPKARPLVKGKGGQKSRATWLAELKKVITTTTNNDETTCQTCRKMLSNGDEVAVSTGTVFSGQSSPELLEGSSLTDWRRSSSFFTT